MPHSLRPHAFSLRSRSRGDGARRAAASAALQVWAWGETLQSGHFPSLQLFAEEEINPRGFGQPVWGHTAISTLVYSLGPHWGLEHAGLVPKLQVDLQLALTNVPGWLSFPTVQQMSMWQFHWDRPDDLIRAVGDLAGHCCPSKCFLGEFLQGPLCCYVGVIQGQFQAQGTACSRLE